MTETINWVTYPKALENLLIEKYDESFDENSSETWTDRGRKSQNFLQVTRKVVVAMECGRSETKLFKWNWFDWFSCKNSFYFFWKTRDGSIRQFDVFDLWAASD